MLNAKKENINIKDLNFQNNADLINDSSVSIHTMQDDLNAMSGIFVEKDKNFNRESVEGKRQEENKKDSKKEQYFNPFLGDYSKISSDSTATINKEIIPDNIEIESKQKDQLEPIKKEKARGKKLWIIFLVLIISAFSFGGYYFWSFKKSSNEDKEQALNITKETKQSTENNVKEEKIEIETGEKYSTIKANYLPINTIDSNQVIIQDVLLKTAEEIKNLSTKKPIEFVITDEKNNNPVSFSVFSVISGIKLSSEILKNISDDFSLYFYPDSSGVRLGLVVNFKEKEKIFQILVKEEPNLVKELAPLFLNNEVFSKTKVIFKDGNYMSIPTRYFNIDEKNNYSVDYAFIENSLVLGTSKDTMWAILEKISSGGK